jgi:benzoate-CoA ligase family protein
MRDHTVTVDRSTSPSTIAFAPNFNVAVPFIDRHLDEGRAEKIALQVARGPSVTYGELASNVNRAGNCLKSLGLSSGDRILMMVKDSAEFYFLFWGAIKAGFVPVPINTLLRSKDYQFMIEDSGCSAVVYSPEFESEVGPAIALANPKPVHQFRTEGDGKTLTSLMSVESDQLDAADATSDATCFWLYSSGTTGTPKGAVHLHRDMVVTSEHYGHCTLGVREDDVCFSAAKLFFAYGLGNGMTFPLWSGASAVVYPGPPTPDVTFEVIETYKPSIFFGVPTLYAAQLKTLENANPDLSSLRVCVSAGEALPADIFARWKTKTNTSILDGIGSTEALHIFISNKEDDFKAGTSGRMVPGYDAKIVGDDGQEVAQGDSGQLMIRGLSTASHYWNNPEKTSTTMVDGWLNTGDTYIQDEEGYYAYCGRNDDMLKVGGIWCSPFEIEAKLIEHPKVLEAAIVGREDDANLTKPEAFIVLNDQGDNNDDTKAELLQHCKLGLAKYKYPRWVNFVEELPKTATGKIQRFKLR